jgi:hypothetical protein
MPYGGDPSASFADAVRYAIGDTGSTELVSDAEIAYLRSTVGDNVLAVAAEAARNLAHKYAALVDQTVGRISVSYSQKAKQYQELFVSLRRRAGQSGRVYAGGISLSDKTLDDDDSDRPTPDFSVGAMDA